MAFNNIDEATFEFEACTKNFVIPRLLVQDVTRQQYENSDPWPSNIIWSLNRLYLFSWINFSCCRSMSSSYMEVLRSYRPVEYLQSTPKLLHSYTNLQ